MLDGRSVGVDDAQLSVHMETAAHAFYAHADARTVERRGVDGLKPFGLLEEFIVMAGCRRLQRGIRSGQRR